MSYEINVSYAGRHLFATHERSLSTLDETKALVRKFRIAFPEAEGYQISVSRQTRGATVVEISDEECALEQYGQLQAAIVHLWRKASEGSVGLDELRQRTGGYRDRGWEHLDLGPELASEFQLLHKIAEYLDPNW